MHIKTRLLNASIPTDVNFALELLKNNELVAIPTETVYGLAARADDTDAINKIFIAKNRPQTHPLIVHIADFSIASEWAINIPEMAAILAKKFWPGALTMLLKKHPKVNDVVTAGQPNIALRSPDQKITQYLLQNLGTGLAAPSANLHKKVSATTANDVMRNLSGKIAAVLDAGPCKLGLESTIIDLTGAIPKILRPGPVSKAMLEKVLGMEILLPAAHNEKVAGNMRVHYQPTAKAILMNSMQIAELITTNQKLARSQQQKLAILHYSALPKFLADNLSFMQLPADKAGYASLLYQSLNALDLLKPDLIIIETPPNNPEWLDVCDRLARATA